MDSDSENEQLAASNPHRLLTRPSSQLTDDDMDTNGRSNGLRPTSGSGFNAPRVVPYALESNHDWTDSMAGLSNEERDRVHSILSAGGMMSAGSNIERRTTRSTSLHQHTFSAPPAAATNLTTPATAPLSSNVNLTSDIQPPPDKSGWLYKRGNLNSSWKKRWFVLRYQTLKYYKKSGDSKSKGFISLSSAMLTPGSSEKMRRLFGFEISSMKYSRVFVIHADSEAEMKDWMDCLQKNIDYVSQVIEREKRLTGQNISSGIAPSLMSAQGNDKGLKTFNSSVASQQLAPEQNLSFEMSEDYLKSIGIVPRLSAWRRDVQRSGLEEQQSRLVQTSSLRSSQRLTAASCFAVHNTHNAIAVGCGSTHSDDISKGTIQLINVDTRDQVSSLTQAVRFGNDLAPLAANLHTPSRRMDEMDRKSSSTNDDLASVASLTLPCSGEVTAMSWMDEKLIVGSSGGIVAMYHVPEQLTNVASNLQPIQFFQHEKVATIPLATPGKWAHSSRIGQVALNPVDKKTLLTLANQYFFLWDTDRGVTIASEVGSTNSAPIFAAAWNPHGSAEFMFGGEEGALRLLDSRLLSNIGNTSSGGAVDRSKCVPWFTPRAHTDVIRDIAWSPLVPYWIASASEDGLVKVWDTRFGSEPVRVLSGHTNGVLKVNWSRSHCEMLVSGSSDKTTRVWNLRTGPHYTMYAHDAIHDDFTAPIIHAAFSPVYPFQVFAGSMNGECVAMHLSKELVANYVVHRTQTKETTAPIATTKAKQESKQKEDAEEKSTTSVASPDPDELTTIATISPIPPVRSPADEAQEREIYTLLYLRDYNLAFKAIATLAQKYWTQGFYQFANQLLKLTGFTSFLPLVNEPNKSPPGTNTIKVFNSMLVELSRFLPPKGLTLSPMDPVTQSRIKFLALRLMVIDRIEAGRYQDILQLNESICKHLAEGNLLAPANSPTSASPSPGGGTSLANPSPIDSMDQFDSSTLEKMAKLILPYDHLRGIEFCLKIAKTLKDTGNFSLFIGIARTIFFPTIYERMEVGSPAEKQCSYIKILSTLAHTPIGSGAHLQNREESRSESESESENSTNSRSSSQPPSRKPSDLDLTRPTPTKTGGAGFGGPMRPSVSVVGSPPPTPMNTLQTTNARGSITVGNEMQHAQITLDRDLRNPKIVLSQLTLLSQMFHIIKADEDAAAELASPVASPSTNPASSPTTKNTANIIRFNPYLPRQPSTVANRISLETLGMPLLSSNSSKEIARLIEEHKEPHKLLPSILHFLYFHSLISQKKYDLVFVAATKIGNNSILKSYQFANILEGVMNEITVPKFTKFLERLLNKDATSTSKSATAADQPGANLTKLQAASLTIINMLYNCDYIPEKLSTILPRYLREFHEGLKQTLTDIRSNPNYVPSTSYSSAKADCKAKAEGILNQMTRIKGHSKIVGEPHCNELVVDFANMLKKFLD